MLPKAKLVLENGAVFEGYAFGDTEQLDKACAEVVFNTAMSGYQEILTDPSYAEQIVTLTYPHIGNVGTNDDDCESGRIFTRGLIVREIPIIASSWRNQQSLHDFLAAHHTVALGGVDTRALTNLVREQGALRGCIAKADTPTQSALSHAKNAQALKGLDLAQAVTAAEPYRFNEGTFSLSRNKRNKTEHPQYQVAVYDFGVKRSILNRLADKGMQLSVYPANTPADTVLGTKPDGIVLSNGPGDPEPCRYAIDAIQTFLEHNVPLLGICLGHQLLSLACGAQTEKMKFGHHGANHPVQDLRSRQVFITSQNHGFTIAEDTLPHTLEITHRSLFDNSIQGVRVKAKKAFAFQGHPEASPGPHDVAYLFDEFTELMQ